MKIAHVVHEFGTNAQHRIVLVDEAGEFHPGEWAAFDAIALNGAYKAANECWQNVLPVGVFRCAEIPHKSIT